PAGGRGGHARRRRVTMTCGRRVLVVEDDHDVREALVEALEASDYHPMAAANGSEALQRLRSGSEPPCVILLDVMMPVMDGREFREEQRRDPALAEIPVVVLSAHGDKGEDG